MSSVRLFTDEELEALALPPQVLLGRELAGEIPQRSIECYDELESRFCESVRRFEFWEGATLDHLSQADRSRWLRTSWLIGFRYELSDDDLMWNPDASRAAFAALVTSDRLAGALDVYSSMEDRYRRMHDAHRDWLTFLWSELYREAGVDALERFLRGLCERGVVGWMEQDLALDPRDRLERWARIFTGGFANIRITEHDDRFVITQDPCGACGRQVAERAYSDEPHLAVVTEAHPITFGRGNLPVYRAHVAVMNWLMPRERIGVPWPAVHCPDGLADGVCRVELMKDPYSDPACAGREEH